MPPFELAGAKHSISSLCNLPLITVPKPRGKVGLELEVLAGYHSGKGLVSMGHEEAEDV